MSPTLEIGIGMSPAQIPCKEMDFGSYSIPKASLRGEDCTSYIKDTTISVKGTK